jgi:hypothetical protein
MLEWSPMKHIELIQEQTWPLSTILTKTQPLLEPTDFSDYQQFRT